MERRSFLKSLGIVGIGAMIRPSLFTDDPIRDNKVYRKGFGKFVNHMTIQRRIVSITGSCQVLDYKFTDSSPDLDDKK